MAKDMMATVMVIITVMAFYSMAINIITYSLPDDSKQYLNLAIDDGRGTIDINDVSNDVQQSLTKQTNIPIIDVGALVFYSSNILLDLLLNFAFAIPQMLGFVINALTLLFAFDPYIVQIVELFASSIVMILYIMGLINLIMGIRSGSGSRLT